MATWIPRLGELVEIAATTDRGRIIGTDITANGPILFRVQRFSTGAVQGFTLAELAALPPKPSQNEDDYEPPNELVGGLSRIVEALASASFRIKHVRISHADGTQRKPPYYYVDAVSTDPSVSGWAYYRHVEGRDVDTLVQEAGA